jgi:hypothetical protein
LFNRAEKLLRRATNLLRREPITVFSGEAGVPPRLKVVAKDLTPASPTLRARRYSGLG